MLINVMLIKKNMYYIHIHKFIVYSLYDIKPKLKPLIKLQSVMESSFQILSTSTFKKFEYRIRVRVLIRIFYLSVLLLKSIVATKEKKNIGNQRNLLFHTTAAN